MTGWKDQKSLDGFVKSDVHRQAIRQGYAAMTKASFARAIVKKTDVPLPRKKALEILKKAGRGFM